MPRKPVESPPLIRSTTVLCVRRDGKVAVAGDGQVTVGNTVMKHGAAKVRRLYHDKILAGFAGSAADAFALFSRFEAKLEEYRGNMERSVVELAKDWRMDKYLRQLQAFLIVAKQSEQKMFGLDRAAAKLTRFETGKNNDSPGLLGIAFKHWFLRYCGPLQEPFRRRFE